MLGKLIGKNFKKLKLVEIDFDDNGLIKITGPNEAGKSTVLELIWVALGGKREFPEKPIREGEDRTEMELKFPELDINVKRIITENSHRLEVTNNKGNKYSSPQSVLNGLFNKIGLMPRKFADAKKDKQVDMLMDVVDFAFDKEKLEEITGCSISEESNPIETIDKVHGRLYDERKEINSKLDNAEENYKTYADIEKTEYVEVNELVEEKDNLQEKINNIDEQIEEYEDLEEENEELNTEIEDIKKEIAKLQKKLKKKQKVWKNNEDKLNNKADKLNNDIKKKEKYQNRIEEINKEIKEASKTNKKASKWEEKQKFKTKMKKYQEQSNLYTATLKDINEFKDNMLAKTDFPITGLTFKNGEVWYEGQPFSQASKTQQLEVGVAINKANNPDLKIMLIKDGNTIDSKHLQKIKELVDDDFVILMECMDESGEVGIVIEDGEIKQNNYEKNPWAFLDEESA
jgi:DNA repair exonuclease SbcCD ATPase subunit